MTMYGLEKNIIDLLLKYFSSKKQVMEVYIYDSGAMGCESKGSDIDFAILTTSQEDLSGQIKLDLEELPTPYLFDVCDLKHLSNPNLQDHIKRVGKLFYQR